IRIVEPSAMHRAPEVRVQLEVGAAPLATHGPEDAGEVILRAGMRTVQRVPWSAPPAAEGHAVRPKRRTSGLLDEPFRMLLEDSRLLFRDERRDPDRRLESAAPDLGEHRADVAAERRAGLEPVTHRAL